MASETMDMAEEDARFYPFAAWLVLDVLAWLWLAVTLLKESPVFWLNAGGYPVLLRETVRAVHLPLGLLAIAGGLGQSVADLRRRRILPALFFWFLIGAALACWVANNLLNLWNGLPLHHHG